MSGGHSGRLHQGDGNLPHRQQPAWPAVSPTGSSFRTTLLRSCCRLLTFRQRTRGTVWPKAAPNPCWAIMPLAAYDAYSRTYHVDGDRYVTVIGYDGNSYLDEDGNLQQADNTLVESEVSTYSLYGDAKSYVNSAGSYQAMLTVGAEEGTELLTIASDDHLLTLTPARGDFSDGIVNDNAIRYNNVLPDVDYQYTVFGNSVKEDIILLQRGTVHSFRYLLNTYGLKAALSGNTLYLYEEGTDPEQDAVFVLEAPEMEDAAGEISFGVELQLEESGEESTYAVTVSADSDWLDADDRVYPGTDRSYRYSGRQKCDPCGLR